MKFLTHYFCAPASRDLFLHYAGLQKTYTCLLSPLTTISEIQIGPPKGWGCNTYTPPLSTPGSPPPLYPINLDYLHQPYTPGSPTHS